MSLIIADSCFKSLEIDFENKIWDLSGYFSTQNTPIEYWAMFETGEKGNKKSNQTENCSLFDLILIQGRIFSFQKGGLHEWDTANFEIAARSAANHFVALL